MKVVRRDHRPRVLIIGAGYAGMTAAHRLAGRAHVTVVNPIDRFVDRIRLHQYLAGTWDRERVAPSLRESLPNGADLIVARVAGVGPGWARLTTGETMEADHIVLAVGSGAGGGIGTVAGVDVLRRQLEDLSSGDTVRVLGAGHTGVEVAAELLYARPELQVELVDPQGVLPRMPVRAQKYAERYLRRQGAIISSDTDLRSTAALTIPCTGFATPKIEGAHRPNPALLVEPGLWVAGDVAGVGLRMSCAAAEPMGAHVADNILRVADGREPTHFSFGFALQCVSLGRRDGVVQFVHGDDSARHVRITGAAGAVGKELICRMARRVALSSAPAYRWPAGTRGHTIAAASTPLSDTERQLTRAKSREQ